MQNNQTKIGLVLVLIIILGVIFMISNSRNKDGVSRETESKTLPAVADDIVEVNYTTAGFTPEIVEIKVGQKVKFINKTGKTASVASDEHPTHDIYPEFDQWKSAYKGQNVFEFTFTKVGTWRYHDHLNPEMVGTVIVK